MWRNHLIILTIFSVPLIFTLVCSAAPPKMQDTSDTIIITERDNNGQVEIVLGAILVLKLEAIPGTGYSWQVMRNDPALLNPLGESIFEPKAADPQKGALGAPAYQTFRFKAQSSGTRVLELQYKRGWEEKALPMKTFRITVRIH